MELTFRAAAPGERLYIARQSTQIEGQTGSVGHLRVDMGEDGKGFFPQWTSHRENLDTEEFQQELECVMEALVGDEQYGGFLKSRDAMRDFCREHPESALDHGFFSFGFRADTAQYACLIQLHPYKAEENLFIYCYRHDWLERHMEQAEKGIRFIDPHYKELFRIPDGERIIVTDRDGKTESYPCRYIDSYHTEVGRNLFHICEFAERMEQGGCTYAPMEPPLPPMCYSILPSTGEVIQIDRWQKGYTATSFSDGNRAENEAIKDKFNEKLGVTKAQEQAMLAGSMIRWDSIAAKPKSYDENGKAIKPKDYER